jgi:D-beta-D-heptose 7-phosphate kinase/D-beta-D-heptose 1-phosphate adenosyltransferase
MENKIKSISTLKKTIATLKKKGKKIVFTNGCFDILHKGHIKLFKKAKSLGDVLIVAINSDDSVKEIKGPKRPVTSAENRAFVLSAISYIDFVTIFYESTPARAIVKLNPDIIVKGRDWKKEEIVGKDFVESKGGKIYTIPLVKKSAKSKIVYSTSNIIKAIKSRVSN